LSLCLAASCAAEQDLTYRKLAADGIVSGFGAHRGDPLALKGRIPAINRPSYVPVKKGLYPGDLLCIGRRIDNDRVFSPIESLNSHEVVNHGGKGALCFCPLAGLCIAVDGDMTVSGLLRYDTFVLLEDRTGDLLLPFPQEAYRTDRSIPLREIQLLNYRGVVEQFPAARILDPGEHNRSTPYGSYTEDTRMGVGHPRPGIQQAHSRDDHGHHPKELVLVAGFAGRMQKAYPLSALKSQVARDGGSFTDTIGGKTVTVHYHPLLRWANVTDATGASLNVAYAYIFALLQSLPDIPVYQAPPPRAPR